MIASEHSSAYGFWTLLSVSQTLFVFLITFGSSHFIWLVLEHIVTIYIGNLSFQATEEDLREVFAEYGKVSRVSLPIDRETGKKRGFAFVEMETDEAEDAAIADLNGAEWLGRELKVNKAKPRESGGGYSGFSRSA